jgi:molybdopterin synthase catalytic subunit
MRKTTLTGPAMGVRISFIYRPILRNEIGFPVSSRQTGAILEAFELVREQEEGVRVRELIFSASEEAQRELQDLVDLVAREFNLSDVEFWQRLGSVPVGEASRLLRLAGPDEQQTTEALHVLVDRLSRSRWIQRQLQRE